LGTWAVVVPHAKHDQSAHPNRCAGCARDVRARVLALSILLDAIERERLVPLLNDLRRGLQNQVRGSRLGSLFYYSSFPNPPSSPGIGRRRLRPRFVANDVEVDVGESFIASVEVDVLAVVEVDRDADGTMSASDCN
jgi:hypothetical protein